VCATVAGGASLRGLELLSSVDPSLATHYRGDDSRLRQILSNLVSNAVKFTQEGEVVVRVLPEGDEKLRFEVSDTGIGIDAHRQAHLWDAFTQADSSTTREYGGTGLGLTISRQLVERMGGSIGVTSEPGLGSTFAFSVTLPVADDPGESSATADLTDRRIIVVDDNSTNRTILDGQLTAMGALVTTVAGGAEALVALHAAAGGQRPIELAILDLDMPQMDGVELTHRMRAQACGAELPVIMLASSGGGRAAAHDAGIETYLIKPVRHERLARALATALPAAGPVSPARIPGPGAAAPPVAPGAMRLLVVEDNPVNQLVARAMLERRGYRVDVARDGLEAVSTFQVGRYGAIFMDCQMPRLDGYDTTERIRSMEVGDQHVPIIAMTANAMQGDRERCLTAGMDDYLTKPIDSDELREALARWVRREATHRVAPS
jgi:CheY-like chemotaxis protein